MLLTQIVNFFIPSERVASGDDNYDKARTLVIVCMATVGITLLFFANRVRINGLFSMYSATLICAALAVAAIPFLLKVTRSIKIANVTLILLLAVFNMVMTVVTGGPMSPSLVFIPLFPLGGFLYVSYRFGLFLWVIFAVHLGMLAWASQSGILPDITLDDSVMPYLQVATTAAATLIFGLLALLHVRGHKRVLLKLQSASEAKSAFLSGMSHELRTPLNAIMGFSDMLHLGMAGKLNEKQASYSKNILSSSTHMLSLVNDLLDIAKIESGEMELKLEPVALEDTISACVQMVNETASKKHLCVESEFEDSIAGRIANLDSMKFSQIILNLLSNAIKFSEEGGTIWLRAGIVDDNIVITIADEGDGIPPEYEDKIFDKFVQASNATNSTTSGTGLGLPISRSFAELHEGTLQLVANDHAAGACFELTIPFKEAKKQ